MHLSFSYYFSHRLKTLLEAQNFEELPLNKQIQQIIDVALHGIIQKRETLEEVNKYFIINLDQKIPKPMHLQNINYYFKATVDSVEKKSRPWYDACNVQYQLVKHKIVLDASIAQMSH